MRSFSSPFLFIFLLGFTQLVTFFVQTFLPQEIVYNDAAFFGLIKTTSGVLTVIAVGFIFFLIAWRKSAGNFFAHIGALLIAVGAVSNIIDRLVYGSVIDYIPFFQFSTFNLADVEIVLGALLLSIEIKK